MSRPLRYDLHIHSGLSPCADRDMTPNNIANMALVAGLDVIALTDHNESGNCRVVEALALERGIGFLAGMELCTNEDIHVLCLFESCDSADAFARYVHTKLPTLQNREDLFGEQVFYDGDDNITGHQRQLLIVGADISLPQVPELVGRHGGVAIPAHIEKPANGLLSILGSFPEDVDFPVFESTNPEVLQSRPDAGSIFAERHMIVDSDAHYLWEIGGREQTAAPGHPLYSMLYRAHLRAIG